MAEANRSKSGASIPLRRRLAFARRGRADDLRANEISKERPKGRFGIEPWSAHDLRRTALTGMARLGVAPIVLGHVANHRTTTRAGVTLAVYSQYTYDKEKRAALDLWAARLLAICGGPAARVLPLRRSKGGR